jgi:hypothetical protein
MSNVQIVRILFKNDVTTKLSMVLRIMNLSFKIAQCLLTAHYIRQTDTTMLAAHHLVDYGFTLHFMMTFN